MIDDTFTLESCIESATNTTSMTQWMQQHKPHYKCAYSHGWIRHVIESTNWNVRGDAEKISRIIGSAKKYNHKSDWQAGEGSAYALAKYYGVFELATQHMKPKQTGKRAPKRKLTKEKCIQIASQFKSRTEFKSCDPGAYNRARSNCFLDMCCKHM